MPKFQGNMSVGIVLPPNFNHPIGGYKVHYTLANELARRGNHVTVMHLLCTSSPSVTDRVKLLRDRAFHRSAQSRITWHPFEASVRFQRIRNANRIPARDLVILTGWQTVPNVKNARAAHVQVVYDLEHWHEADELARESMRAAFSMPGVTRVATSKAVARMLGEVGASHSGIFPPGVDSPLNRPANAVQRAGMVLFPLRHGNSKGGDVAVAAASLIHAMVPEVEIVAFGTAAPPAGSSIDFRGLVSDQQLQQLLGRAAVFFVASRAEGFGLPALEAMAAGCCVVTTNNGGSEEYAIDRQNCLVVPPGDPHALAAAVVELLQDDSLRERVAWEGAVTAQGHSSSEAFKALAEHILSIHAGLEDGR